MQTPTLPALPVERELTLYARALVELISDAPAPWGRAFDAEVRLVRTHLTPLRSRPLLASSFGRESFGRPDALTPEVALERLRTSPVHVAYAMAWLELR